MFFVVNLLFRPQHRELEKSIRCLRMGRHDRRGVFTWFGITLYLRLSVAYMLFTFAYSVVGIFFISTVAEKFCLTHTENPSTTFGVTGAMVYAWLHDTFFFVFSVFFVVNLLFRPQYCGVDQALNTSTITNLITCEHSRA